METFRSLTESVGVVASGSVCQHIRDYYPTTVQEPPCYWTFSWADVSDWFNERADEDEPPLTLNDEPSTSGDDCHRGIEGLSDSRAGKFFKAKCRLSGVRACSPEGDVPPTTESIREAKRRLIESL